MIIPLRIECPHCRWGYPWDDKKINQGYVKLQCNHCNLTFWTKITITGFSVETTKEFPNDRQQQESVSV